RPAKAGSASVAAGERPDKAVVLAGVRRDPAEAGVALHSLRARRHPLRKRIGEGLEHYVDETRLRLPAAHHGTRVGAVDDRAKGCVDAYQPVEAVVGRNVMVDETLEHVGAGVERLRIGRFYRRVSLEVAAGREASD